MRAGQVGSRSAILASEKALVRFQDFRKRFSVVLDAFRFSESHVQSGVEDITPIFYSMWRTRGNPRGQLRGGIGEAAPPRATFPPRALTPASLPSLPPRVFF